MKKQAVAARYPHFPARARGVAVTLERIPIRLNRIGAPASCFVAFSATNRRPLRRKML